MSRRARAIPIDTFVLVVHENRSFDHYLSQLPAGYADTATIPGPNHTQVARYHQTSLCAADAGHSCHNTVGYYDRLRRASACRRAVRRARLGHDQRDARGVAQWSRLAAFFTYDEAGGFYDHVPPPAACAPDAVPPALASTDVPGDFARYGFRVPLIVATPCAKPHHLSHVVDDHTSLLRLLELRFGLPALDRPRRERERPARSVRLLAAELPDRALAARRADRFRAQVRAAPRLRYSARPCPNLAAPGISAVPSASTA